MKKIIEQISKESIDEMTSTFPSMRLRMFVEGPKGVFNHHFKGIDTQKKIEFLPMFQLGFIDYDVNITLIQNKNHDKIELELIDDRIISTPISNRFKEIKRPNPILSGEDKLQLIKHRALILAGLTLTGIVSGSHVKAFNQNQKNGNRLFKIKHETIYPTLRKYMDFTGDIYEDYKEAAKIFWFHFPVNMTGFDSYIKRITLEDMTNHHRI